MKTLTLWLWILAASLFVARMTTAQVPCQGGTATAPACARSWATAPLSIQACPASVSGGNVAGTAVVLRETNGTPLLSVNAATPGGLVTLASSQAPLALAGSTVRVIEFKCTAPGFPAGGAATFATVTFPQLPDAPPVAPLLP